MGPFDLVFPGKVIFGAGRIRELPEVLKSIGSRRPLLVTGISSMEKSGALSRVVDSLSGLEPGVHGGVRPNLPAEDVDAIIDSIRSLEADAVIGMGGGSALDGAKAAAWMAPTGKGVWDYVNGFRSGRGLPFFSVPTTSGTGSEVTPFIILLDRGCERKISLGSEAAFARAAIVDPDLTVSLSPYQTASTGLDALSHCLDSYWSRFATPFSDAVSLAFVPMILENLVRAYKRPDDLEARAAMSHASMAAGLALAQTATSAVHGLTYPLSAIYGVPHGMACAFLMREVFSVNFHHLETEKQKALLYRVNANTKGAAIDLLSDLYAILGVPDKLEDLKISSSAIPRLANEAAAKNMERNITRFDDDKIMEIWKSKVG